MRDNVSESRKKKEKMSAEKDRRIKTERQERENKIEKEKGLL